MPSQSLEGSVCCQTCGEKDFYEDDYGNYICNICATQSQDYIAEAASDYDSDNREQAVGRQVRTIKSVYRKVSKKEEKRTRSPTSLVTLLQAYQFCLVGLAQDAEKLSCVCGLSATVKRLWEAYLGQWQDSGQPLLMYFKLRREDEGWEKKARASRSRRWAASVEAETDDQAELDDKLGQAEEEKTPSELIPPSKNLLLAFIYLAARCLRSRLVACDLIRWVLQGRLGYNALLERLPADLRRQIHPDCRFVFLSDLNKGQAAPSPANVLFHTEGLSQFLGEGRLPALNVPLVARAFVESLGLPEAVWAAFADITQLFRPTEALPGLRPMGDTPRMSSGQENELAGELPFMQHVETIMAAVVVACKMTPGWMEWIYERPDEDQVVALPSQFLSDSALTRKKLPAVLRRLKAALKDRHLASHSRHRDSFMFNGVVGNLLAGEGLQALVRDQRDSSYAMEAGSLRPSVLKRWDKAAAEQKQKQTLGEAKISYLTYVKCSSHLLLDPAVLRLLVEEIDTAIVLFLESKKKASQKKKQSEQKRSYCHGLKAVVKRALDTSRRKFNSRLSGPFLRHMSARYPLRRRVDSSRRKDLSFLPEQAEEPAAFDTSLTAELKRQKRKFSRPVEDEDEDEDEGAGKKTSHRKQKPMAMSGESGTGRGVGFGVSGALSPGPPSVSSQTTVSPASSRSSCLASEGDDYLHIQDRFLVL